MKRRLLSRMKHVGYTVLEYQLEMWTNILLTFRLCCSVLLRPEEDRSSTVETSAGYLFTFKLVFKNHVSYMIHS